MTSQHQPNIHVGGGVSNHTTTPSLLDCSAYVGSSYHASLQTTTSSTTSSLGATVTITATSDSKNKRGGGAGRLVVEITEAMVEEVTQQAGTYMSVEDFIEMLHDAILGKKRDNNEVLTLFIETFPQMKNRVLGGGSGEEENDDSCGEGGTAHTMFLSIDRRGVDGGQALFPVPLTPIAQSNPPINTTPLVAAAPTNNHLNRSSNTQGMAVEGSGGGQENHGGGYSDPYHPNPSQHQHQPVIRQQQQHPQQTMIIHTNQHHRQLQYSSPPNKMSGGHPTQPLHSQHNGSVSLARGGGGSSTAMYNHSYPTLPAPAATLPLSTESQQQQQQQHLRSRIVQLESENAKLHRENEALAKLTKEKMVSMQAECGEVQRRVMKDQAEIKSLRVEVGRLDKDLGRALRERDIATQQLASANSRIRMMGGSPHRSAPMPARSGSSSRPPSVGSRGTSRPPSPVVRSRNTSRTPSVDVPPPRRRSPARAPPAASVRHPVNTSGGSAQSRGSSQVKHAKPWGAGPGGNSPSNRRPSPQQPPRQRANRFDSPAHQQRRPTSNSSTRRPLGDQPHHHHNISQTSSQCTVDKCNKCSSGPSRHHPASRNRFDSPTSRRRH